MLGPGSNQEPLHHLLGLGAVFHHAPGVGAVAQPFVRQPADGGEKRRAVFGAHGVGDLHHDRPAVVGHGFAQQGLGPVVRGLQVGFASRQPRAVEQQGDDHQAGGAQRQRGGQAHGAGQQAPAQAAGGEGAVEYREVDGQAAAAHPVGQNGLGHAVEGGQRGDPAHAQQQHQRHGQPLRRRKHQGRHHTGADQRSHQHQAIGIEPAAQMRHDQRTGNGAGTDGAQHHAIEARRAAQHLARHQRQQGPDRAGKHKEHGGAQQHAVQFLAGEGVAQAGTEGAEKVFGQRGVLGPGALPPDQRADHEHIAEHVEAIGRGRAKACKDQASGRGANGARDIDAQRVECHRALEVCARHQLGHDGLPGGPHQRRAYAADEGQRNQILHRQRAGMREQQQRAADGGQHQLHKDQEAPAVQNVRQHTCGNGQQEDGQRGRGLDQRHGRGAGREVGHQPRTRHVTHEAASVAQHGGRPQHGKYRLAQGGKAAGRGIGLVVCHDHTAQQAQPSAPQKLLASEVGSCVFQAPPCAWPCTLQALAQAQAAAACCARFFSGPLSLAPQAP